MNEKKQQLINFDFEKIFHEDFYISKSNKHILDHLWPKLKNFLNISGENYSGKSHLIDILKNKGIK